MAGRYESDVVFLNRGDRSVQALAVRYAVLVLSLIVLVLGSASVASAANFYWYGEGGSTCWQTGQLGSSSTACSNVGAGYLPTPGGSREGGLERMVNITEGGVGVDVTLSPSQDYCSYYRLGDNLTSQDSKNEVSFTGFETPTPYSSYQEGDGKNVCQADGSHWGQGISNKHSGAKCKETCGMHHYVSFRSQGENDQPWSGVFGEPSLVLSAEADPQTFEGSHEGYGYVCPELEDKTTKDILEYCLQEWRGEKNGSHWEDERVGECKSWGEHNVDLVLSYFWPGASFATERSGSTNTYVWQGAGGHHFEAAITKADLINAINLDRAEFVEGERPGEPALGKGCGRSLSTEPDNYVLVGVEQGLEAWGTVTEAGESTANLQLRTEYTPLPPEATTGAASEVQLAQATLNGTVNPRGTDTHYYFQYGKTEEYGSSTASTDLGSGMSSTPVSATIAGLSEATTYHYRVVATNAGEKPIYGSDQVFTTPETPNVVFADTDKSDEIDDWSWNSVEGWHQTFLYGDAVMKGSSPSAIRENGLPSFYMADESKSDEIDDWSWNSVEGWHQTFLYGDAVMKGSSPSAIMNNGQPNVYMADESKSDEIDDWSWNSVEGWHQTFLYGDAVMKGSSPSAIMNNGQPNVYMADESKSDEIDDWSWNSVEGWHQTFLYGDAVMKGSSPSAVMGTNGVEIFFADESKANRITDWTWSSSTGWHETSFAGDKVAAGTSPSAVMINGVVNVFFVDGNKGDTITDWTWNSTEGWHQTFFDGDSAMVDSSPSGL